MSIAIQSSFDEKVSQAINPEGYRPYRKCIFTLNIGNYEPEIREITYPLIRRYAEKIGADFFEITDRAFPEWPITYEKMQVAHWSRQMGNDWNIFVDADALINPEMFDVTAHLSKDTVCHNGKDMAGIRWKYDQYFLRDGRNIGSCNWLTFGSDWCLDLWRPLDISLSEALSNINITNQEYYSGNCKTDHLIDDYTLSRNIARFGLKFTTIKDIQEKIGVPNYPFLWHVYTQTKVQKLRGMLGVLTSPANTPAPPFGVPGEFIQGAGGQPLYRTSQPSDFGPANHIMNPVGTGWGLMEVTDGMKLAKSFGLM